MVVSNLIAPDIANGKQKVGTGVMAPGVGNLVKEDDFIPVPRCKRDMGRKIR